MPVLTVDNLRVAFGDNEILRGVSLELEAGTTLGVVGESGCGKSMTGFALMGMIPRPGRVTSGSIRLGDQELTTLSAKEWSDIRGSRIALVMQDPFTSLNPMMRIGDQIAEVLWLHRNMSKSEARAEAVRWLGRVGVPEPELSASKYPHQMSGGQRQRVVIAIAFACHPEVLIADEPTTALDVTLQAQILRLIQDLQRENGTAVMLISHDIGVIGSLASRIAVFYAGRVIELGSAEDVLRRPGHPYTQALLASLPRAGVEELFSIGGQPPDLTHLPQGCAFRPRCPHAFERCVEDPALLPIHGEHGAACWLVENPRPTAKT